MKTLVTLTKKGAIGTVGILVLLLMTFLATEKVQAQPGGQIVTGEVTSNDGPLLGATIVLKGTRIGVASDENGNFTFPTTLEQNDVLVVSYLGYKTREITIQSDTTHVKSFLEDEPIIVVAALRMEDATLQDSQGN